MKRNLVKKKDIRKQKKKIENKIGGKRTSASHVTARMTEPNMRSGKKKEIRRRKINKKQKIKKGETNLPHPVQCPYDRTEDETKSGKKKNLSHSVQPSV
jgi:hypothetical protein